MPKTQIESTNPIGAAARERGGSFIDAALLILNNLPQDKVVELERFSLQLPENIKLKKFQANNHLDNTYQALITLLESLKIQWQNQKVTDLTFDHLAGLEFDLIELLRLNVYALEDFKEVKNELDNAENHINWKRRAVQQCKVSNTHRQEEPVEMFTHEVQKEWCKILDKNPKDWPEWFKALPLWEQNYFIKRLKHWKQTQPNINLGVYLGVVPTTIRRYPGSANTYVTSASSQQGDKKAKFIKVRSGAFVPSKMPGKTPAQKHEKFDVTRQNIEQCIEAALRAKISQLQEAKQYDPLAPAIEVPVLLQTLFSPPLQPGGEYDDKAIQQAIRAIEKKLHDNNGFLRTGPLDTSTNVRVKLLYSNRPVNNARGLSRFLSNFNWHGRQSRRAMKQLSILVAQMPNGADKKMAQAALEQYKKSSDLWDAYNPSKPTRINVATEKAALEQIIISLVGISINCCVSGKDRVELVTQFALAQQEFYLTHGHFPSTNDERAQCNELVAAHYLSGYGHTLAGENAKGCNGLKSVVNVLGKDACQIVRARSHEYGFSQVDPVKDQMTVANMNKISVNKMAHAAKRGLQKWVIEPLTSPALTEQPSKRQPEPSKSVTSEQNKRRTISGSVFRKEIKQSHKTEPKPSTDNATNQESVKRQKRSDNK